jgi:hypothetical protein
MILALGKTERRYVTTTDGKKNVSVGIYPILMQLKISNPFILSRWSTKCVNTVLFFPLEFSINGC